MCAVSVVWLVLWGAQVVAAEAIAIDAATLKQCLARLLPLPHEIAIPSAVTLPREAVAITTTSDGEVERQAADDLRAALGPQRGAIGFEIILGATRDGEMARVTVPDFARLQALPNREQAYLIRPLGATKLLVAALAPPGVFYGSRTVLQLVAAQAPPGQVTIPLATVTDWPDLPERGLWNNDLALIPWLADLKLNFALLHASVVPVQRDKPLQPLLPAPKQLPNVLEAARRRAMTPVVATDHLNYLGHFGKAYAAYPEIVGQGDGAVPDCGNPSRNVRLPCATSPVLRRILTEYLTGLARQGVTEVGVWLSEHVAQCQCPACLQGGQLRNEMDAAVAAWQEARRQYPALGLRLFCCMGGRTAEETAAALAALPPEVKLERCYGNYGQAFWDAAANGRWVASYAGPALPGASFCGLRLTGLTPTRDMVKRLLAGRWRGLYSINYVYSTGDYQRELYGLLISALAEWAWNNTGRSVRELAVAGATREGKANPELLGEWAGVLEPLEARLSLSGAGIETWGMWSRLPAAIARRQPPTLGQEVFSAFPKPESFGEGLQVCDQALALAEHSGHQDLVLETRYAAGYIRIVEAVHHLLDQLARPSLAEAETKREVQVRLQALHGAVAALNATMDQRTALLISAPRDFAGKIGPEHAGRWQQVEAGIAAAVQERLK